MIVIINKIYYSSLENVFNTLFLLLNNKFIGYMYENLLQLKVKNKARLAGIKTGESSCVVLQRSRRGGANEVDFGN